MKIRISDQQQVSALFDTPSKPHALLLLAHGAGAGMEHVSMRKLAEALHAANLATLRFQFPYMERKSRRPDPPAVATNTVAAVAAFAAKKYPKLRLFAGGKSFGGRMTTTAASLGKLDNVRGIVCFGFPLHPAKQPGTARAAHLAGVTIPMLWLQGTRDDLADLKLVRKVVKAHPKITLEVLEGADHSYHVLKSSGRTDEQILAQAASAASRFCRA